MENRRRPPLQVLFEDNHCLAIAKPAGSLTTGYDGMEETLDRLVKQYLKDKHKKPGNVFLGVVHRLDRMTSGVLIYARTSKAAARLAEQFREGAVQKVYWAVVEGIMETPSGRLEDWLRKNDSTGKVEIVARDVQDARHAVLTYERKQALNDQSWLEVRPETGRTHQIRVQLASRGHPVWGDVKYGARTRLDHAIALHARSLTFLHPVRCAPITLTADLPIAWARFRDLGLEGVMP